MADNPDDWYTRFVRQNGAIQTSLRTLKPYFSDERRNLALAMGDARLDNCIAAMSRQEEFLRLASANSETVLTELQTEVSQKTAALIETKDDYEAKLVDLNVKISQQQATLLNEASEHKAALLNEANSYRAARLREDNQHEAALQKEVDARARLQAQLEDVQVEASQALKVTAEHRAKAAMLKDKVTELKEILTQSRQDAHEAQSESDLQLEELQAQHEEEMTQVRSGFEVQMSEAQARYDVQIKCLQQQADMKILTARQQADARVADAEERVTAAEEQADEKVTAAMRQADVTIFNAGRKAEAKFNETQQRAARELDEVTQKAFAEARAVEHDHDAIVKQLREGLEDQDFQSREALSIAYADADAKILQMQRRLDTGLEEHNAEMAANAAELVKTLTQLECKESILTQVVGERDHLRLALNRFLPATRSIASTGPVPAIDPGKDVTSLVLRSDTSTLASESPPSVRHSVNPTDDQTYHGNADSDDPEVHAWRPGFAHSNSPPPPVVTSSSRLLAPGTKRAADADPSDQSLPISGSGLSLAKVRRLEARPKAEQIWNMFLPDWDMTPEQEFRILAQLESAFSAGKKVDDMIKQIDKYVIGAKQGNGGRNMTQRACTYCSTNKKLCLWATHVPGVATGCPPRIDDRIAGHIDRDYDASAMPRTVSVDGREVRWVLKLRKSSKLDPDDPQIVLRRLNLV